MYPHQSAWKNNIYRQDESNRLIMPKLHGNTTIVSVSMVPNHSDVPKVGRWQIRGKWWWQFPMQFTNTTGSWVTWHTTDGQNYVQLGQPSHSQIEEVVTVTFLVSVVIINDRQPWCLHHLAKTSTMGILSRIRQIGISNLLGPGPQQQSRRSELKVGRPSTVPVHVVYHTMLDVVHKSAGHNPISTKHNRYHV